MAGRKVIRIHLTKAPSCPGNGELADVDKSPISSPQAHQATKVIRLMNAATHSCLQSHLGSGCRTARSWLSPPLPANTGTAAPSERLFLKLAVNRKLSTINKAGLTLFYNAMRSRIVMGFLPINRAHFRRRGARVREKMRTPRLFQDLILRYKAPHVTEHFIHDQRHKWKQTFTS